MKTNFFKLCNAILLTIISCSSFAQSITPPEQDWYRDYWPDEQIVNPVTGEEKHLTKAETGEDWLYDLKLSKDINTGKPDGIITVGYQAYQCNNNVNPINSYCPTVNYCNFRSSITKNG